jgi:5-methylthioadenosine/S-adenosylhomocysteine deaminase
MSGEQQILINARVLRLGGDLDLPPVADVLIGGDGRIAAIGDRSEFEATAPKAAIIDLAGHILAPGFVNAHYHSYDLLAKGCFESQPLEQWGLVVTRLGGKRSLEEVRIRTLLGAIEALRNGITTIQDFSVVDPMDDAYADAILGAYAAAGLRVIFSITVRDRSQIDTIPGAAELVPADMRSAVGDAAGDPEAQLAFVERQIDRIGERNGMVIWALSPSAPQRCSVKLLEGVSRLATARRLPVYTHVYETRAQRLLADVEFYRHDGSLLRYMDSVGLLGPHVSIAHGVWPDEREIEMLARTGTGVVLNMLSNLRLRSGVPPIARYRHHNVRLALGSDNCSCSDVQSMFQVMKLYCLLGGVMDPAPSTLRAAEALSLATLGGARSAGRSDEIGAIEVGMRADLIALDLDDPAFRPLNSVARQIVYAETGRSVRHVWVDGRIVVRDGRSAIVDEEALAAELLKIMPRVRQDIERFQSDAAKLSLIFEEIGRRTWSADLSFSRYLHSD